MPVYIAVQHKIMYHKLHINLLKDLFMKQFYPLDLDQAYQTAEKYAKDAYNFWLDIVVDTLKMYKK